MPSLENTLASAEISFPDGTTEADAHVVLTVPLPDAVGVVLDGSPFHPESHSWPDQPGDIGTLEVSGNGVLPVVDTITGAQSPEGQVLTGGDIPVRKFEDGWLFFPVLVVPHGPDLTGARVRARVDALRRHQLSAHHTAEHLMALALNRAIVRAGGWKKPPPVVDSLGHGDFDRLALTDSQISIDHARDAYRFGKSLRRKGIQPDVVLAGLEAIAADTQQTLDGWVAADAAIRLTSVGGSLSAVRTWRCVLPDGEAAIPCGGTHLRSTGALSSVRVVLSARDDMPGLIARTEVAGCAP